MRATWTQFGHLQAIQFLFALKKYKTLYEIKPNVIQN
jgi:hypothetical protein